MGRIMVGSLKNKPWLTIQETTSHLSDILMENISESDIYRYALENKLQISVNFVNCTDSRSGKIVSKSEAKKGDCYYYENGDPVPYVTEEGGKVYTLLEEKDITDIVVKKKGLTGIYYDKALMIDIEEQSYFGLHGVYDLLMAYGGKIVIQDKLSQAASEIKCELVNYHGIFVADGLNVYQLQNSANSFPAISTNNVTFYPADNLPEDCFLVVRTDEISKFIKSMRDESKKDTRHDTLANTIDDICNTLSKNGQEIKTSIVWDKLIEAIENKSIHYLSIEEDPKGKGMLIVWSGIQGNIKRLTYSALRQRLYRRKKSLM